MRNWVSVLMGSAMLFGCGSAGPESLADCKARFANLAVNVPDPSKVRFDFTYEFYDTEGVMDRARDNRSQMTLSKDGGEQVVREFLQAPAVPQGAYFLSEDLVLEKKIGSGTDLASAIEAGCTNAPKGAKLFQVNVTPIAAPSDPG